MNLKQKNTNNMRLCIIRFLFVSVLLLINNIASAQAIVSGTVTDSIGKAIPFSQVLLKKPSGNSIVTYSLVNNSGEYKLTLPKSGIYQLEARALGFATYSKEINIAANQELNINIVLGTRDYVINEVVVVDNKPITIKEDTVVYDVASFVEGDEEVAEEVLEKLPGFDVEEDGKIKFQGKAIDKVLVEGDDLFEKGYQLLTKGLDAGIIEKVEALTNQTENEKLKGIDKGDQVVINLLLKKDIPVDLFGNATGYGTDKLDHSASLKLMAFTKRLKFYSIFHSNNMGEDPMGNMREFYNTISFHQKESDPLTFQNRSFLNLNRSVPLLKRGLTMFNNSQLASINTIVHPSKRIKIKLVSFLMKDLQNFESQTNRELFLLDSIYQNREVYGVENHLLSGYTNLKLTFDINHKSSFIYDGKYSYSKMDAESYFQFNDMADSETLRNTHLNTSHDLEYTTKINQTSAVVLTSKIKINELPENYQSTRFGFFDYITTVDSVEMLLQNINQANKDVFVQGQYLIHPFTKVWLKMSVGNQYQQNEIQSEFYVRDSNNIEYFTLNNEMDNQCDVERNVTYADFQYKQEIGDFRLTGKLKANLLNYRSIDTLHLANQHKNYFYYIPALGVNWDINNINKLSIMYVYNMNPLSVSQQLNGYYASGYNTLLRGTGEYGILQNHNAMLTYTYGNLDVGRTVNMHFIYNYSDKYVSNSILVNGDYSLSGMYLSGGNEMIVGSLHTDWFIRKIYNGLKLKFSATQMNNEYVLNNVLQEKKYLVLNPSIELKSAFLGWFNYHIGASYEYVSYLNTNLTPNRNQTQFVDIRISLKKRFKFDLIADHYYFSSYSEGSKSWYFAHATASYDVIPKELKVKFQVFNIFDENVFGNRSLSDYSITETEYKLRGRYFMLGGFYRF